MSAPARPHRPTPADLARRSTPAPAPTTGPAPAATRKPSRADSVAGLVAPGRLLPGELFRRAFQQGMRISRMRPEARLTALTLFGYAHFRTGRINKHLADAKELSYATGLTEGQVLVQLEVLTQRGWLTRRTLASGPCQGEPVIRLCVPAHVLQQLRDRQTTDT